MPRFDRTGPLCQGSLTGRGLGPCGLGLARGRGLGRFYGWGAQTQTDMKKNLQDYKKALQEEIEEVEKELGDSE